MIINRHLCEFSDMILHEQERGSRTCKMKRIPAQGSAAWTGSYWTAVLPTLSKVLIHVIIFSKTSLKITVSPLLRVYFHLLWIHSSFDFSARSCNLTRTVSLSWLKFTADLSQSFNCSTASAHRSFLHAQLVNDINGYLYTYALLRDMASDAMVVAFMNTYKVWIIIL
jgi:hypothetical protein